MSDPRQSGLPNRLTVEYVAGENGQDIECDAAGVPRVGETIFVSGQQCLVTLIEWHVNPSRTGGSARVDAVVRAERVMHR